MVMEMKLRQYAGPRGRVLILDTGGRRPPWDERHLLCCRSLTLPVDGLLAGPVGRKPPFGVLAMDLDGQRVPLEPWMAAAFAAFLRDAGYAAGETAVTDGRDTCRVPAGTGGWRAVLAPEGRELRYLLGLRDNA